MRRKIMTLSSELETILGRTCSSLGTSFVDKGGNRVLAQPSNRLLFAKIGPAAQILGEAESLAAMHQACLAAGHGEEQALIPTVHAYGNTDDGKRAYLVTDYKNLSGGLSRSNQRQLGKRLAEMHKAGSSSNGKFGFGRATHCGETVSNNLIKGLLCCVDLESEVERDGNAHFPPSNDLVQASMDRLTAPAGGVTERFSMPTILVDQTWLCNDQMYLTMASRGCSGAFPKQQMAVMRFSLRTCDVFISFVQQISSCGPTDILFVQTNNGHFRILMHAVQC